jgi:tetratricopeptide (TPR) repeat protein
VSLSAGGSLQGPFAGTSISLPAGGDASLDWGLSAPKHGTGTAEAKVRAGDVADAERRSVRVLPYGVPMRSGTSGTLDRPVDWRFDLPADAVPGTLRAELRLAPSVTAQVLSALDELAAFPYGCVEQTVNRFYPALMAAKTLRSLGRDDGRLLPRLDAVVRAGVRRLTYLQQSNGSWGWWGRGRPNSYMTAYATLALAEAKAAKYAVPKTALARAIAGIDGLVGKERDEDLRAFLRYARVVAGGSDLSVLADSYARRSQLGARGLAWLALAYARGGFDLQTRMLATDLVGRVEVADGIAHVRRAPAGRGTRIEASSLALRALLAAKVDPELTDRLALGLAAARAQGSFGTTIETGAAVLALSEYVAARGAGEAGFRVEVTVNDETPFTVEVASHASGRERVEVLPAGALQIGANRIRIRRIGAGRSTFALSVTAVTRKAPPTVGEGDLTVERRYAYQADPLRENPSLHPRKTNLLRPGGVRREPDVSEAAVGDIVRVTLDVAVRPGIRFLQVEDPLPAGFSAMAGTATGGVDETVIRQDRIVFFIASPGERVTITYLMRAGFPGKVRVPSGRAFPMYRPAVVAYSNERAMSVSLPGEVERPIAAGLTPSAILALAREAEAKDPERAAVLIRALLERFDLKDDVAALALRLLGRTAERLGRPAEVMETHDQLAALLARPSLEDAVRSARAAVAVNRSADAIGAVNTAVALLYGRDRKVLDDLGSAIEPKRVLLDLAGRYPFGPVVEASLSTLAHRSAQTHDDFAVYSEEIHPEMLEPLRLLRALYPTSPAAPGYALRHARSRLRESNFAALEAETRLLIELYPDDAIRATADWFLAYALFAQERYEDAIETARKSFAKKTYMRGKERGKSPFSNNLAHLLAQAHHILGDMPKALGYYRLIEGKSLDAAAVLHGMSETRFEMPWQIRVPVGEKPTIRVTTRNVSSMTFKAHKIDLLAYFALRKGLPRFGSINLDGIGAVLEKKVELTGRRDRKIHETDVALDLEGPGVYLVLAESGNNRAATVVFVSDLEVKTWTSRSGVRALVTNAKTGRPVKGAYVVTSDGIGGITDARGIYDSRLTGRHDMEDEVVEVESGKFRSIVVAEKDGHVAASR